jgi:hypothetical protein
MYISSPFLQNLVSSKFTVKLQHRQEYKVAVRPNVSSLTMDEAICQLVERYEKQMSFTGVNSLFYWNCQKESQTM